MGIQWFDVVVFLGLFLVWSLMLAWLVRYVIPAYGFAKYDVNDPHVQTVLYALLAFSAIVGTALIYPSYKYFREEYGKEDDDDEYYYGRSSYPNAESYDWNSEHTYRRPGGFPHRNNRSRRSPNRNNRSPPPPRTSHRTHSEQQDHHSNHDAGENANRPSYESALRLFGLRRGATKAEITKKYKALALKTHPNKGGTKASFQEMQKAYTVLKKGA